MHPIDIALSIATKVHAGRIDFDGYPTILHALSVGLMGHTDEEKMTGFLHDAVAVGNLSFDYLAEEGIPTGIVNALRVLHRNPSEDYLSYIDRIITSNNPIALQVKRNDLDHNCRREVTDTDRLAKHRPALTKIEAAIEECSKVDLYDFNAVPSTHEIGIFACGCFWGAQYQFEKEPGVVSTLAGYTGGNEEFPSYADVRDHKTHHVEAVIVEYDPTITSYEQLCKVFFEIHDPAQTDGVGPDLGPQYRSCIFFRDEKQKSTIDRVVSILRDKGAEVNTLILPADKFYIGEKYHQRYYEMTGGEPYCHVRIKKF